MKRIRRLLSSSQVDKNKRPSTPQQVKQQQLIEGANTVIHYAIVVYIVSYIFQHMIIPVCI